MALQVRPFAVVNRESNTIISSTGLDLAAYLQRHLRKALPQPDILETQAVWRECLALSNLAGAIVAQGHGGTVLIVPGETGKWSESLSSFPYRFANPDTAIRDVIRQELNAMQAQGAFLQRLSQSDVPDEAMELAMSTPLAPHWGGMQSGVLATASLASIDGAVVLTRDLRVLGFGAKIAVGGVPPPVCMFRPQPGSQEIVASPLETLGGTRHQSAARFVEANRDSLALIVSQHRHMSVAHWHEPIQMVAIVRDAQWWI